MGSPYHYGKNELPLVLPPPVRSTTWTGRVCCTASRNQEVQDSSVPPERECYSLYDIETYARREEMSSMA
ncbi:hypothetical protein Y032_0052g2193 [Ancylostoma ceylanicum]|uniref:Uncharacterized protein n=1 Tax=Ancylostoma ceylanicum TaxID=53326 RepID=A0A016U8A9_9BILA|nr:hypothetical protein Y032_0052g2193 [Ancylostoma ceylanicum]